MKRFLIGLVVVVACVAVVGLYRGWFQVTADSANEQRNVTFSADKNKIKEDEKKVVQEVKSLGNRVKDKSDAPAEKSKDQSVQAKPPQDQE
jgi:gas vesicle protein